MHSAVEHLRRLWGGTVLLAFGRFLRIFASRALVVRVFLHPPEAEISTLLLSF